MRGTHPALLFAVLSVAVVCLASPASAGPPTAEDDAANLYRAKCGKCHRPYKPSEIERGSWERYFPKMQKRAHLSAAESETIRAHVEKGMPPAPTPTPPPS
jgi:hypothetical protein